MPCCVCQVRFHHSAAAPRADNVQSPSARAVTITCAGGISSFSRVPCNDLVIKPSWVGRTGEVPCNDSALHRLIEIHQPKRAKASPRSAASARYECAVQLARPNCEFTAGGGGKRPFATISSLAIAAPADWHLRELQCCRSIANTPKDLICLQSAIAAEQCSAAIAEYCLQLQEAPLQL